MLVEPATPIRGAAQSAAKTRAARPSSWCRYPAGRSARVSVIQEWLVRCRAVGAFDRVVLIYNPVNRRVPLTLAESMRRELGRRLPDVPVALQATQHAGHARELARAAAATGRGAQRGEDTPRGRAEPGP